MEYVDGYLLAVPTSRKDEYIEFASKAAEIFKEYGAIRVAECWGDDVPLGELTSFPKAVQCAEDETVVFSWITWPSREARDDGNAKVMADPRLKDFEGKEPYDGKRMIYGGFMMVVDV